MSLKDRIKSDIKDAMRAKDVAKKDTLRNIQAAIRQIEIDERRDLSDNDIETVLVRYVKQREDAKAQFEQAGRDDLVTKEQYEIDLVKGYLPEPMSEDEIRDLVSEIISKVSASSMKDMGRVMGEVKKLAGSRADGATVSKIVKSILAS